jgi:hypothetical protein
MKLISRSQSAFRGQDGKTINEGDEFYIDGDTPEKDLSQRGKQFLGDLRSGNQFLCPDTPEADEFLAKLAKRKKLEAEKKKKEESSRNRPGNLWSKIVRGVVIGLIVAAILFFSRLVAGHYFPQLFHSPTP